jgi:hypothetical protein
VRADGSNSRALTSGAAQDLHPSWQPGSESSVDKVGGHTQPGPVDRSPGQGKGKGKGDPDHPGGQPRVSPRLRITRVRWRAAKVHVVGRTAPSVAHRLKVTFGCGGRASQRSIRLVFPRGGRFGTTLKAKHRCRHARRGGVTVAYGGDTRYMPDRVTRRVRHR